MIRRGQHVIYILLYASESHPPILLLLNFGWLVEEGNIVSVKCTELPAPKDILLLNNAIVKRVASYQPLAV